jgi:hypothetical protein
MTENTSENGDARLPGGVEQIQCVLCDETSDTVEDHNLHMEDIHGC